MRRPETLSPWVEHWLGHQRRDGYWKHGSVCEQDYSAIECPVYAVGGFVDGYTNAVPRLLEGLSVPRKGLIGPWAHAFPDDALPGPSIGFCGRRCAGSTTGSRASRTASWTSRCSASGCRARCR